MRLPILPARLRIATAEQGRQAGSPPGHINGSANIIQQTYTETLKSLNASFKLVFKSVLGLR